MFPVFILLETVKHSKGWVLNSSSNWNLILVFYPKTTAVSADRPAIMFSTTSFCNSFNSSPAAQDCWYRQSIRGRPFWARPASAPPGTVDTSSSIPGLATNMSGCAACSVLCAALSRLEDTARYAGLLLAPAEGFGRGFFALRAKNELFMLFWPILGDFWCPVVTVVTFSSNLSNFERTQKNGKIQQENSKNSKKLKKIQKSKKIHNPKSPTKIQKIQKKSKKSIKNPKNQRIVKNGQKFWKSQKISKNLKNSLFFYFFF